MTLEELCRDHLTDIDIKSTLFECTDNYPGFEIKVTFIDDSQMYYYWRNEVGWTCADNHPCMCLPDKY